MTATLHESENPVPKFWNLSGEPDDVAVLRFDAAVAAAAPVERDAACYEPGLADLVSEGVPRGFQPGDIAWIADLPSSLEARMQIPIVAAAQDATRVPDVFRPGAP